MLKKYNQYINESLLNKMEGPSEEEVIKNFSGSPINLLRKSISNKSKQGIELAFKLGAKESDIENFRLKEYYYIIGDRERLLNDLKETYLKDDQLKIQYVDNLVQYDFDEELINFIANNYRWYEYDYLPFAIKYTYVRNKPETRELLLGIFKLTTYIVKELLELFNNDFRLKIMDGFSQVVSEYKDILKILKHKEETLKESILNKLEGPNEEEVWNNFKVLPIDQLFLKSCQIGYLRGIEYAIEKGVDVNGFLDEIYDVDNNGINELILNKHNKILEYLLKKYNDKIDKNDYIDVAITVGNFDALKLLVEYGGEVTDEGFTTAYYNYNFYDGNITTLKYILENGFKPSKGLIKEINKSGTNEVKNLFNKYIDLNESLLDKLEGPTEEEVWSNLKNLKGTGGTRLLTDAIKSQDLNTIKLLLDNGIRPHSGLLYWCCEEGYLDIIKLFVEYGVDIHTDQEEAFHRAVRHNQMDVVKYLVEQGVDIHSYHDHAFKEAERKGYDDILSYLKSIEDTKQIEPVKKHKGIFKKFFKFNESLLNKMVGPTKEEIEQELKNKFNSGYINMETYYKKSKQYGVTGPTLKDLEDDFRNSFNSDEIDFVTYYNKSKEYNVKGPTEDEMMEHYKNQLSKHRISFSEFYREILRFKSFNITFDEIKKFYNNSVMGLKDFITLSVRFNFIDECRDFIDNKMENLIEEIVDGSGLYYDIDRIKKQLNLSNRYILDKTKNMTPNQKMIIAAQLFLITELRNAIEEGADIAYRSYEVITLLKFNSKYNKKAKPLLDYLLSVLNYPEDYNQYVQKYLGECIIKNVKIDNKIYKGLVKDNEVRLITNRITDKCYVTINQGLYITLGRFYEKTDDLKNIFMNNLFKTGLTDDLEIHQDDNIIITLHEFNNKDIEIL